MPLPSLDAALRALRSERVEEIEQAIDFLAERLPGLEETEFRVAAESLCGLFYVDTGDRPDLQPLLEKTVEVLVAQGSRAVAVLLNQLQGSDIKSHLYLARTLGAIGRPALAALRRVVATEEDAYTRSFALFALGKVHDPAVREALPEVMGSLMHPDKEVRDSAARTLGKIAEVVEPDQIATDRRGEIFEALFRTLADFQPAVRAKAVRSLGKMARAGYLAPEQEERVRTAVLRILGRDEAYEWDRAYIVRREAEETLRHLEARVKPAH
jgi:hypothetical protein